MLKIIKIISVLFLSAVSLTAQTADEVLDKYYEALGGKEKFYSIKSWHLLGTSQLGENPGGEYQFIFVAPDRLKIKTVIDTFEIIQAVNRDKGWHIMPMRGITEPTPMSEMERLQVMGQKALVLGPFDDYKKKGATLEFNGVVKKDGAVYKKLTLQAKDDGPKAIIFLNDETNLIEIIETETFSGGMPVTFINKISDYKEVDGIMIPFNYVSYLNGKKYTSLKIDTVILNKQYNQNVFTMPENGEQ